MDSLRRFDRICVLLGLALCMLPHLSGQAPAPPGAHYEGEAFTFHGVGDDIYLAVGTGNLTLISNAAVIVNRDDVLVVDTFASPAGAWALLRELKRITPKPVRFVVNTHHHLDHVHGNQVFPSDVQIIGHEATRRMILAGKSNSGPAYDNEVGSLPRQIMETEALIGKTPDPARRAELERLLSLRKEFLAATSAVVPTPPNVTLSDKMTLHRGDREIQLLCFGRGHSIADVVVYLPKEKILITGDLLIRGVPFIGESYPLEWIKVLERLKGLEVEVILPGHGLPFRETEYIGHLQAYLQDLWSQSVRLYRAGVGVKEATAQIDLRKHAGYYPNIKGLGAKEAQVARIYELQK